MTASRSLPGENRRAARETPLRAPGGEETHLNSPQPLPTNLARPIIGLLGGIGAGKTHVANRLAALGPGRVVDADGLAHVALEALAVDGRLSEAFGETVVRDGKPDRAALARIVFRDASRLRHLERLVHPQVQTAIRMTIEDHRSGEGPRVLILDVPLLIEVGLDRRCDALWFVDVPHEVRLARARGRGLDEEELQRRAQFQSPLERKRARSDFVVDNHVDPEALDEQLLAGLARLGVDRRGTIPASGVRQ